jgi:hypothetical protein
MNRDSTERKGGTPMSQHSRQHTPGAHGRRDQEGMALVLAIMVLLVLTVIGAALMANVNTETKISGLKVRDTQALTVAEAGVQEAMLRLKNGDIVDDGNPRHVTMIFNQVAGSVPNVGTDSTALATLQTAGSYLTYSTASKGPGTLVVKYKTRGNQVLKYDDAATPKINTATGNPIWIVQATGTEGPQSRTVYAEVTKTKFNVLARAAVAAKVGIVFSGNINICGHDHVMATPISTMPPACDAGFYDASNPGLNRWWAATAHGSCLPGAWSGGSVQKKGSSVVQGEPSNYREVQTGFYSGPWDVLGMTQSDFYSWVGSPTNTEPNPPTGIFYLDNDVLKQNGTGNWHYNGGDGEGFLYCDGDLRINGNFNYRGLIYVEGDLDINGNCWILGGLIVKGKSVVKIANGSATILYSSEAIQQKISQYGGNMRTIAWREL